MKMISEKCLCYQTRAVSRLVTKLYDKHFRRSGIRSTQFYMLCKISAADSICVTALSETLAMERTTLSRNLRLLEERQLVKIVPVMDSRKKVYRITELGASELKERIPIWETAQQSIGAVINELGENESKLLEDFRDKVLQVTRILQAYDLSREMDKIR